MKINSFIEVEKYLRATYPDKMSTNWTFALKDMQKILYNLGDPQDKIQTFHVAGTSGKTSTAYYLSDMLSSTQKNVGLYISPHVDSVTERIQINNRPLSKNQFTKMFSEFINQPAIKDKQISYFGLLAAFAYWVFAQKKLDYSVIEVGMGGRLDATNVIKNQNKICVITDIGMDHTEYLGNNLIAIAKEKAGIIGKNNNVFIAPQTPKIIDVFDKVAKQNNAKLHIMPKNYIDNTPKDLPLFQKRNWSLANFVFNSMNFGTKTNRNTIITKTPINVPARMETIDLNNKKIILDVSHNAQKISALVKSIKYKYPNKNTAVLLSMSKNKDSSAEQSLTTLKQISNTLIISKFIGEKGTNHRAMRMSTIENQAQKTGFNNIITINNPIQAFNALLEQQEDILLVTGSFFLLNDIRPILNKRGLL